MSTIVVAQKNGVACIGADTMSSLGSLRQKANHIVNKTKITKIGDTFIGLTGTSTSLVVMNSYFANPERPRDFSSTAMIFETFRHAHHWMKAEYFMSTMPDKGASWGHKASTACAMAPAALPAPKTSVRPLGAAGKNAGVFTKGNALVTAASNNWRKKVRGLDAMSG